ncbi:MAG: sulfurtransferase [Bacteroidota bacterium]
MSFDTLIDVKDLIHILDKENLCIIDTRFYLINPEQGKSEYLESHLPGAYYAHLDDDLSGKISPQSGRHPLPEPQDLAALFSNWGIGPDTQVVIYDQNKGAIAARLWFLFNWMGHEKVAVLNGGWTAWMEHKGAISSELPKKKYSSFAMKLNNDLWVDSAFMEQHLQDPTFKYLDARINPRYLGEIEPIDPVAGHIPGAISLPFEQHSDEQGKFLSEEELRASFKEALGETSAENVVCYCGSGITACHHLISFKKAGLGKLKLYPGSWSEWIRDPNRPIEGGDKEDS